MRIRHSMAGYIIPGTGITVLLVLGTLATMEEMSRQLGIIMLISAVCLFVYCVLTYKCTMLEVRKGFINGKSGIICKQTITIPLSTVNGCEVTKVLWLNRIHITSGKAEYVYADMEHPDAFKRAVEKEQARTMRGSIDGKYRNRKPRKPRELPMEGEI